MGCATGLVKYLVFLANLVFALAGLALVIVGVVFKFNYSGVQKMLPSDFGVAPLLFIIIGVVVFFTAFQGCCGAVKESPCMLTTYAIILLSVFLIQVVIGVYLFLQIKSPEDFNATVRKALKVTYDNYDKTEEARNSVDALQTLMHCCGLDGPNSFNGTTLPASCCKNQISTCSSVSYNHLYHDSCSEKLYMFIKNSSRTFGGIVLGVALVEVLGAVFALCLASSIRNQRRRSLYA